MGWKVLTHDYRPPLQGGAPVFDGTLPFTFPREALDESDVECGNGGWHYCDTLAEALRIAGYWPDGWPSVVMEVEPVGKWVKRGDKCRAESLLASRWATDAEIVAAIEVNSQPFGEHGTRMIQEQILWREALGRPARDEVAVVQGLEAALQHRGLQGWVLKQFPSAREAWDAKAAWDTRVAWDAWGVRDTWDALTTWETWDVKAAWAARDIWVARETRIAWDARAAWDVWNALVVCCTALNGWIRQPPDLLTVGIRDAYRHGLGIAVPMGTKTLGWAMAEEKG